MIKQERIGVAVEAAWSAISALLHFVKISQNGRGAGIRVRLLLIADLLEGINTILVLRIQIDGFLIILYS